ncbi:MAG: sugar phosphate isomerase/epimerase [Clostridia bacterium]|nr:sugar phosphate isomerase/epimerase [Clostridia bacterium]
MIIGAQLYSVHNFTKNLDDFAETLKKVADIGYTSVQVSGTCHYEGEWLAEQLKANGLTCDLTHYAPQEMIDDPVAVVEKHKKFGCKYIGVGALPNLWEDGKKVNTKEKWENFVKNYTNVANVFKANGAYLMYHNHDFEFENVDGEILWTYLKENFTAEQMGFTLDTHWVLAGGHDPIVELNDLVGRTPCVHFKDLTYLLDGERRFAPVGSGIINFDRVIKTCIDNKVEYAFVEQDNSYGEDPFACLKKSYDYLKSMGLN